MATVSIILLTLFIIIMILFIAESIHNKDIILFLVGMWLNIILFITPIAVIESHYPNKRDVKKGDAIFVKYDYINIKNDDTISYTIYEIEWKNK